jgi:hypothetical protein
MLYNFKIDYDILKRLLRLYRSDEYHELVNFVGKAIVYGICSDDAILIWQSFEVMDENRQIYPGCTYVDGRGMLG